MAVPSGNKLLLVPCKNGAIIISSTRDIIKVFPMNMQAS